MEPDYWDWVGALGVAQYRVGAYEDALPTLARAKKIRDHRGIEPGPVYDGFIAMALRRLGRDKEANAVLQQIHGGFRKEWFSGNRRGYLTRVIEVEKSFVGQDKTLLSIWKRIEENKLDEASELIEKARQSKDADYVNRMEGAIKLLEVLRKLK